LQDSIAKSGLEVALDTVSGIKEESVLGQMILSARML